MDATLYLGGDLELAVPIRVTAKPVPACGDGWNEPREPAGFEDVRAVRLDGLPWHDACDAAFDKWWEDRGEYEYGRWLDKMRDA